jgi:hypothetical protein
MSPVTDLQLLRAYKSRGGDSPRRGWEGGQHARRPGGVPPRRSAPAGDPRVGSPRIGTRPPRTDAHGPDASDDRIQFLHNDEPADPGGELLDEPFRQDALAEFQDGGVREGLKNVLVGNPR